MRVELRLCWRWRGTLNVSKRCTCEREGSLANIAVGWSLWSKDVIFLITADSRAAPQAWVDAYHELHDPAHIAGLPVKSGAIQGMIAVDYPSRDGWDTLHVAYDGINGQLPNLDLFNTAVHIAGNQMGVRSKIQNMFTNDDDYRTRLRTMLRGMMNQGLGHATGPHSSFIPYHIDGVTLQVAGSGWHDEVTLGRTVESLFRSLNNLLEHFHQSFFFYLLLAPKRFVSIGTYLPSAMLIAVSFTISAIGHWLQSGLSPTSAPKSRSQSSKSRTRSRSPVPAPIETPRALIPPLALVLVLHLAGAIPHYFFTHYPSPAFLPTTLIITLSLPPLLAFTIPPAHYQLITTFSLLFPTTDLQPRTAHTPHPPRTTARS